MAALPYPFIPVVQPAYDQDRGNILFDTVTKSTKQKVSAYVKEDTCGRQVYMSVAGAASINQLVNCIPVLALSFSFSFLVPIRTETGTMATAVAITEVIMGQLSTEATGIYTQGEINTAVANAITNAVGLAPDVDADDDQLTVS